MPGEFAELREAAAQATRGVAVAGLVVQAFGNASEVDREQAVFAIKPSGIPCEAVTGADMVVLSLESGEVVWGSHRPSSDTPTHRVIYQGIDAAGGIVHTHSRYATSWAQANRPIPCLGTTHADHFRGQVPVTRPLTPEEIESDYEENTGRAIVELYGPDGLHPEEAPGALVASHGPFVWGEDSRAAVEMASAVEWIAELATKTLLINPTQAPVQDALLDRHFTRKHGPLAYYGQP